MVVSARRDAAESRFDAHTCRVRKLIFLVIVLVGLAVAADFGAAAYAKHAAQSAVKNTANLGSDPSVDIHGFPFLYQALTGKFDDIQVRADHVGSGAFGDLDVDAHMYGVELTLSDLLSQDLHRIPVDRLDARVRFPATRPLALLDVVGLLPFGVTPTDVSFEGGEVVVSGGGSNLVIDLDQLKN